MTTATLTKNENLRPTLALFYAPEGSEENTYYVFNAVEGFFRGEGNLDFAELTKDAHFVAAQKLWNDGRLEVSSVLKDPSAEPVQLKDPDLKLYLYGATLEEVKPVTSVTRTGWYTLWGNSEKELTKTDVLEELREGWFYQSERENLADRVQCRELDDGDAELEALELQLVEVAVDRGTLKVTTVECFDQDVDDDGDAVYHHEFEYELTL